jgi:Xaa-Pro aminopeptidase
MGYAVKVVPNLLKDARATKSSDEIKAIKRAGDATIESVSQVIQMISEAKIGPNKNLLHHGQPLTVNDIKFALERAQLERNAESAEDTIVAVGRKAFDWHYLGAPRDVLKAGEPVIIDVYPRLKLDRYVADVTRTVVKGSLSEKAQLMYDCVMEASHAAVDALRDGVLIDDVNMACFHALKAHGFDSRRLNPSATEGMTHGLGHGIGLEVHENPSMYRYSNRFSEGHVMAIEPGVYLKSVGGVRVENDYAVTKGKAKRLTPGLDDVISV